MQGEDDSRYAQVTLSNPGPPIKGIEADRYEFRLARYG
jgi:hypothetical protein